MARLAAALLLHLNLLLAMYCGAGLATAVRLRWDPSTYVAARALLPLETRVALAALVALPLLVLALAHLPVAALLVRSRTAARWCYILYAGLVSAAGCAEVAWGAWTAARVLGWLRSAEAGHLRELLDAVSRLQPLMRLLSEYSTVPTHINSVLEEVEADAPCNLVALYCAAGALLALQTAAALLAVHCAARLPAPPPRYSAPRPPDDQAPLHTAYKNGKLVVMT